MKQDSYEILGADRKGPWLITCDHASNHVPNWVTGGDLGVDPADMQRHIAFDIGAAGVTRHLAKLLNAPAILSQFSRLVIDPNRGEDDPTLIMQLYDGTLIPGNRHLDAAQRERRIHDLYRPYHTAIDGLLDGTKAIYIAIHSFTPQLAGRPARPWHVTVLPADDRRFSDPLLDRLRNDPDMITAENEPYTGKLRGDSVDQHALRSGRFNALIEIRNDLIETEPDQMAMAEQLAAMLEDVRLSLNLD